MRPNNIIDIPAGGVAKSHKKATSLEGSRRRCSHFGPNVDTLDANAGRSRPGSGVDVDRSQ